MKICFVLPVKNEEKTIAHIIEKINHLSQELFQSKSNIIIVSDSFDNTDAIVTNYENVKLYNGFNNGLGFAILLGLKAATQLNCEYIFILDSDGQVDLNEIKFFYKKALENKNIDLFLSSRFKDKNLIDYKYPSSNKLGVIILSFVISIFSGFKVTDSHGGIRLMKVKVAKHLELIGLHTYVQESIYDAATKNFNIMELPSKWLKREYGKSRVVISKIKYFFNVAPALFVRFDLHKKFFYTLGTFFLFYGFFEFEYFFNFFLKSSFLFFVGLSLEFYKNIIMHVNNSKVREIINLK